MTTKLKYFSLLVLGCILSCNTHEKKVDDKNGILKTRKVYNLEKDKAQKLALDIEKSTSLVLADDVEMKLWASDSLCPDPVALAVDDKGAVFVTRTVRQKNSEFDIRGYEHWKIPSISWKTVDDRRAFLREFFSPAKSNQNSWLKDLNNDKSHDWKDLAVEKEEIYKIEDTDNDGLADKATSYFVEMMDEVTDIAAGLLIRTKDAFLTMAPDLWRLEDTNGDGDYDKKTSISKGYGVHIGFSGHNMSGPIEGPDGRIYWNMGDIGANITDINGKQYENSNSGLIARSNPDGSDFEIFATGLRNTHEFVFDDFGNLISCDNDGDHPGESERLVHVIEGSDAGWRSNWQYGKYSDPKNNNYNIWMDEKLSIPVHEGQPAYVLPPIQNFHNGPTGMVYNPGTALGKKWLNKFFVVEFVGTEANSKIWSFSLKPNGASFKLDKDEAMVSGICPTGIQFGPDGALYAADWVTGWGTKDYGRVWRIDSKDKSLSEIRKRTEQLMKADYSKLPSDTLASLIGYGDRRIRMKAQFEIVNRSKEANAVLTKIANSSPNQLARIHAIWGLGQIARKDKSTSAVLVALLEDKDDEVKAQAIKMISDAEISTANDRIIPYVNHSNPRVSFFSTEACGHLKLNKAIPSIFELITKNKDKDLYIRHAAMHALSKIGDEAQLVALKDNPNKFLRIAAVVALRKMKSKQLAVFLNDKDEYVVAEAARAINDDHSVVDALPSLAEVLGKSNIKSDVIIRRAINAAVRVGTTKELDLLVNYTLRKDISSAMKKEALSALASWHKPSVLDRVDGRYRGVVVRDSAMVISKVKEQMNALLSNTDDQVLAECAYTFRGLGIKEAVQPLLTLFNKSKNGLLRGEILKSLDALKHDGIQTMVKSSLADASPQLREAALSLINDKMVNANSLKELVNIVFDKGTHQEQQKLIKTMMGLKKETTKPSYLSLIEKYLAKVLPSQVELELTEAIDSLKDQSYIALMKSKKDDPMEQYKIALNGGNKDEGYSLFNWDSKAQCVKCHAVNKVGSNVGPDLTKIGSQLTREQILQALIMPSARIAPGYGTAIVTMKDGKKHTGVLMKEDKNYVVLKTNDAEPLELEISRIENKEMLPSSMPDVSKKLGKKEIRSLVEYLASLK